MYAYSFQAVSVPQVSPQTLLILLSKSYLVRSKITKLLFRWFSSVSFYVFLLRLKYLHRHPVLEIPQSTSFPLYERPSFVHVRNTMHIRILCLLFLIAIGIQREDKDFGPTDNNLFPNLTCSYYIQPGGKAAGAWRWLPTPYRAEVKERVEIYLYSPSGPSWPVLGEL